MNKIDNSIINDINALTFDMLKISKSKNYDLLFNSVNVFYTLFLKHLNYDNKNESWINRDRILMNNKFLPVYYSCKHLFNFDISLDDLKEYKKLNNKVISFNAFTLTTTLLAFSLFVIKRSLLESSAHNITSPREYLIFIAVTSLSIFL